MKAAGILTSMGFDDLTQDADAGFAKSSVSGLAELTSPLSFG
jgi:hypothetical protein